MWSLAANFRQRMLLKLGSIVLEHDASLAYPVAINVDAEHMHTLSLGAVPQRHGQGSNGARQSAATVAAS